MMRQDEIAEILAQNGFEPGAGDVDFIDRGGTTIVELKSRLGGVRDLTAAIMRLAEVARREGVREACLVIGDHKLPGAIERVWASSLELLRPELALKLRLLAISDGNVTVRPDNDKRWRRLGEAMSQVVPEPRFKPYPAFFDVLHVLLSRWLLKQGPLQMVELGRVTGFTQPTLREALDRFGPELERDSRRRVQLVSFPRALWEEMLALAPTIRESFHFSDQSGRPRSADQLLERLARQPPPHVAVGGVVAARFWDPQFNLHGVPRVDLAFHGPQAAALEVVERLDAGLAPHPGKRGGTVVLHRLRRKSPLFEIQDKGKLAYCDPVDTLLDIEELRLHQQAEELIRRLQGARR